MHLNGYHGTMQSYSPLSTREFASSYSNTREFELANSRVRTRELASLRILTRDYASSYSETREYLMAEFYMEDFIVVRSFIRLLHTACFAPALRCVHLFARLLTPELLVLLFDRQRRLSPTTTSQWLDLGTMTMTTCYGHAWSEYILNRFLN